MKRPTATRRHLSSSPFVAEPDPVIEEFAVGDRVTHDKYGLGRIVARDEVAVTADFGSHRVRIPSPFHRLFKL